MAAESPVRMGPASATPLPGRVWWLPAALAAAAVAALAGLAGANPALGLPAAAALVGAGALVLVIRHSELGVYALLAVTYLNLSEIAIYRYGAPSLTKALLLAIGLALAVRLLMYGRPLGGDRTVVAALAAYGLSTALALFHATDPGMSKAAISLLIKDAVVALMLIAAIDRVAILGPAVWALIGAGLVLGAAGTFQVVAGFEHEVFGLGGAQVQHIVGGLDSHRLTGPLDDPNAFAHVLIPLIPLAWGRVRGETGTGLRLLALLALALVLVTFVFTFSRSGLIALLATGLAIWWVWHRRSRLAPLLAVAVLGAGLIALPDDYVERLGNVAGALPGVGSPGAGPDEAIEGRLDEMQVAWHMFLDHPLLGVGFGNYRAHFQDYTRHLGLTPRQEARQAHSLYLEIAAERGLVGLAAFAGLIGFAAVQARVAWRRLVAAGDRDTAALVEALVIALFGYLVMSAFLHETYARYFWLLLGLLLAAGSLAPQPGRAGARGSP